MLKATAPAAWLAWPHHGPHCQRRLCGQDDGGGRRAVPAPAFRSSPLEIFPAHPWSEGAKTRQIHIYDKNVFMALSLSCRHKSSPLVCLLPGRRFSVRTGIGFEEGLSLPLNREEGGSGPQGTSSPYPVSRETLPEHLLVGCQRPSGQRLAAGQGHLMN